MTSTTFDRYLETEVLSADPLKLVSILYRGALEAVGMARRHLAAGLIAERSRQILKAWSIVHELNQSLDNSQGGELAANLAALYSYLQQRLMDANGTQSDTPLAEVEILLATLNESWRTLAASGPSPRAVSEHEPEYAGRY